MNITPFNKKHQESKWLFQVLPRSQCQTRMWNPSLLIRYLMPQTRKYSSSLITNVITKCLRHAVVSLHRLYCKWCSNTLSPISTISKKLLKDLNKGGRMLTWYCQYNIRIHITKVTTFRQLDTSSCWNGVSLYRVSRSSLAKETRLLYVLQQRMRSNRVLLLSKGSE